METIKLCRDCVHWRQVSTWMGNCIKHPWQKPRWSQDADATSCPDYVDRLGKYQPVTAKER